MSFLLRIFHLSEIACTDERLCYRNCGTTYKAQDGCFLDLRFELTAQFRSSIPGSDPGWLARLAWATVPFKPCLVLHFQVSISKLFNHLRSTKLLSSPRTKLAGADADVQGTGGIAVVYPYALFL